MAAASPSDHAFSCAGNAGFAPLIQEGRVAPGGGGGGEGFVLFRLRDEFDEGDVGNVGVQADGGLAEGDSAGLRQQLAVAVDVEAQLRARVAAVVVDADDGRE